MSYRVCNSKTAAKQQKQRQAVRRMRPTLSVLFSSGWKKTPPKNRTGAFGGQAKASKIPYVSTSRDEGIES